ncbi:DNA cytosine methyltransferase [Stigmatella erecta]|uniref:Site-specific DNA-cytosine methylase n=1 Tax=Stigmatella erecta TaxID=83460 RepID=A0A1I0LBL6_9BACT|nr:DNA cytosine methyltransferase [Stigmatella erecta]SEU36913.1 Site-specific DNA-cytosine methylase [Stigmatella erecta]
MKHVFTIGYLFSGSGLGALGSDAAEAKVGEHVAEFRNVGGIDFDAEACEDFRKLTGAPALCADIGRMRPRELRGFFGATAPRVFKWSPPCKGASGLLPTAMAATAKYQDMNRLALKALRKVLAAWRALEERPAIIIIENVPAFRRRCAAVLQEMNRLLKRAGYLVDERTHDLGREGGLAQERKRFTLVARHPVLCPVPVELPPPRRLRGVGEVLGALPWPDSPNAGRLHRLPRVEWLNAVRLALIPPGGDWRDLPKRGQVVEWLTARGHWPTGVDTGEFRKLVEEELGNPVEPSKARREVHRRHPVQEWEAPAPTVSGPGGAGLSAVEDRRVAELLPMRSDRQGTGLARRNGLLGVGDWQSPAHTVIGTAAVSRAQGNGAVADARVVEALALRADGRPGAAGVVEWTQPSGTVIGTSWVSGGSAPASVADPRPLEHLGLGQTADAAGSYSGRPGLMGVGVWTAPSPTVVANASVSGGNAQAAISDPRPGQRLEEIGLGCQCRAGVYGVLEWTAPSRTVTGSLQIDCGPGAVADPRHGRAPRPVIDIRLALQLLAEDWEVPRGALMPAILSPISGCWHRPLTTLELAVLQGLPDRMGDEPLMLAGNSDRRHRERIGNGIPVGGAAAWGRSLLEALLRAAIGETWRLCGGGQWVAPEVTQ